MGNRTANILGLISCTLYLCGNIIYDWMDNTPPDPPGYYLYHIYFIPLSIMITTIIWLAYRNAKTISGVIPVMWWGFMWLSIGQTVKFAFFNPTLRMISDYGFLSLVVMGVLYKILYVKNPK